MAGFIAPLVGGLLGGLGGLFGGGKQQQVNSSFNNTSTTNQNGSSAQQGQFNNYSTPNLSPIQQAMLAQIQSSATNDLNQANNMTGYTQEGLENINQGSQNARQAMSANIAGRGLSFSPAAATAENQNTLSRVAQGNQFLSSVPLLQTQLKQQALQQLMQGFQIQPTAVSSGGTTNQTGQTSQSGTTTSSGTGVNMQYGNPTAGAVSGAGSGLFGGMALNSLFPNLFGGSSPYGNSGSYVPPQGNYGG